MLDIDLLSLIAGAAIGHLIGHIIADWLGW